MGMLRKISQAVRDAARPQPRVVRVCFRALSAPVPEPATDGTVGWYGYLWALPAEPTYGMRVHVPGGDGRSEPAVVVGIGKPSDLTGHDAKPVTRLATADEIRAADAAADKDLTAWLNMARRAAGLSVGGRARKSPPDGYPPIPPATGDATPQRAGEYGRVWYRVYKRAEEAGRDPAEVKAFGKIAHRWYAIRDRGTRG